MTVPERLDWARRDDRVADDVILFTLDETAQLLRVSRPTLERIRIAGDIKSVALSQRTVRVSLAEIRRYLRERAARG